MGGVLQFCGRILLWHPVAKTIHKGLIDPEAVDQYVILAGLSGAILWNILTWYLALPTSSSHALISGYAGAAVAKSGIHVLIGSGWLKVLSFIVLSPVIGFRLGYLNMMIVRRLCHGVRPRKVDNIFRRLQLVSAGLYSLGHGANDAQKTMGIIVALLVSAGYKRLDDRQATSSLAGITRLPGGSFSHVTRPSAWARCLAGGGSCTPWATGSRVFSPSAASAPKPPGPTTLIGTALKGIPISTTHAITGAILGVGTAQNARRVRWVWGAADRHGLGPDRSLRRLRLERRLPGDPRHPARLAVVAPFSGVACDTGSEYSVPHAAPLNEMNRPLMCEPL